MASTAAANSEPAAGGDRSPRQPALARRVAAEFVATAFLLMAIAGSGIMGDRLSSGNVAIALLANAIATGAALVALISGVGGISGAHLNPVVTLSLATQRAFPWRDVPGYIAAQVAGAFSGVLLTNGMFGVPIISVSHHVRTDWPMWIAEAVATFGLLTVIGCCVRYRPSDIAYAVAGYVTAAYWFFPSTSFANPAVTLARSVTDTFSGIRPADVPEFLAAQFAGAALATAFIRWIEHES